MSRKERERGRVKEMERGREKEKGGRGEEVGKEKGRERETEEEREKDRERRGREGGKEEGRWGGKDGSHGLKAFLCLISWVIFSLPAKIEYLLCVQCVIQSFALFSLHFLHPAVGSGSNLDTELQGTR